MIRAILFCGFAGVSVLLFTNVIAAPNNAWQCASVTSGNGAGKSWQCDPALPSSRKSSSLDLSPLNAAAAASYSQSQRIGKGVVSALPKEEYSLFDSSASAPAMDLNDSASADDAIQVSADRSALSKDGTSILEGAVSITKQDKSVDANVIYYHKHDGKIDIVDGMRYRQPGVVIIGDRGEMDIRADTLRVDNVEYRFDPKHARGTAKNVERSADGAVDMDEATYTTCNCEEDEKTWHLSAKSIKLDPEEGVGTAKHVALHVKEVPVFYSPYLSFPINDERRSGILMPSIGSSSGSGVEFALPYYWNIAPNYDATFIPRVFTNRGFDLQTQFRYLMRKHAGAVNFAYMPDDKESDDRTSRWLGAVNHHTKFASNFKAFVNAKAVSDRDYFKDLGTNLDVSGARYLKKQIGSDYFGEYFSVKARADSYQSLEDLSDLSKPYRRLPQIEISSRVFNFGGVENDSTVEWVSFGRDDTREGRRLNLRTGFSVPYRRLAGFIEPRVDFYHTRYNLDGHTDAEDLTGTDLRYWLVDDAASVADESSPDRSMYVASVDSGLIFDREFDWGGENFSQTLEPRLHYLYVPYRSQNDIPLFDTSTYTASYNQLFRWNRFSGIDRIGDTNQLTLGVVSRVLDSDGEEQWSVSAGQSAYFTDRRVYLNRKYREDSDKTSPFIASATYRLMNSGYLRSALHWDYEDGLIDRGEVAWHYKSAEQNIYNLAYRYRRRTEYVSTTGDTRTFNDPVDELDASIAYPLSPQWQLVGRSYYDLNNNRELEYLAGVEYHDCCWGVRLVGRRYLNEASVSSNLDDDLDYKNAIFLEFALKGLTTVGPHSGEVLQRNIFGYQDRLVDF